jgi:hypothetical protein
MVFNTDETSVFPDLCCLNMHFMDHYYCSSPVSVSIVLTLISTGEKSWNVTLNKVTPRSRVLFEKLMTTQLAKKLFFNGTRRFITVFITARPWKLS